MELANTVDGQWRKVEMVPVKYLRAAYPEINAYVQEGGDQGKLEKVGENVVNHVFGDPEVNAVKRALKKVGDNGATAISDSVQADRFSR